MNDPRDTWSMRVAMDKESSLRFVDCGYLNFTNTIWYYTTCSCLNILHTVIAFTFE